MKYNIAVRQPCRFSLNMARVTVFDHRVLTENGLGLTNAKSWDGWQQVKCVLDSGRQAQLKFVRG